MTAYSQQLTQVQGHFMSQAQLETLHILSLPLPALLDKLANLAPSSRPTKQGIEFDETQFLAIHQQSLAEHLLTQLDERYLDEIDRSILDEMISELDEAGRFNDFNSLKKRLTMTLAYPDKRINTTLTILQSLEPAGVGARSVQESLQLQIRDYELEDPYFESLTKTVISDFLTELGTHQFDSIANTLRVDMQQIQDILFFVQTNLSANPCSEFSSVKTQNIIPSYEIIEDKNGTLSFINHESKILSTYRQSWVANKKLATDIAYRESLIGSAVEQLAKEQYAHVKQGVCFIKPYTQRTLAETLSLHSSTISRLLNNKYLKTPVGTFRLSQLCQRTYNQIKFTPNRIAKMIATFVTTEPAITVKKILEQLKTDYNLTLSQRTIYNYLKRR